MTIALPSTFFAEESEHLLRTRPGPDKRPASACRSGIRPRPADDVQRQTRGFAGAGAVRSGLVARSPSRHWKEYGLS